MCLRLNTCCGVPLRTAAYVVVVAEWILAVIALVLPIFYSLEFNETPLGMIQIFGLQLGAAVTLSLALQHGDWCNLVAYLIITAVKYGLFLAAGILMLVRFQNGSVGSYGVKIAIISLGFSGKE